MSSAVCLMRHWRFAMFYVAAELYSSVSISMLFWQFANDVVATDKAKFFYPLFGQVSSLAPIAAGVYVHHYSAGAEVSEEESIRRVMAAVSVCGLAMVARDVVLRRAQCGRAKPPRWSLFVQVEGRFSQCRVFWLRGAAQKTSTLFLAGPTFDFTVFTAHPEV